MNSKFSDLLALGVERRRRFVQKQDLGVSDECARNGDALLLSARQLRALVAHVRLVAVGQVADELVDVGVARSLDDVSHAGLVVERAVGDVLADARVEEDGLLLHDRHLRAQPVNVQLAHIVSVNLLRKMNFRSEQHFKMYANSTRSVVAYHTSVSDVIETLEQRNGRALAAAGSADEGDGAAERHVEVEVAQHLNGGSRRVVEGHTGEANLALDETLRNKRNSDLIIKELMHQIVVESHRFRSFIGARRRVDGGNPIDELEDASSRSASLSRVRSEVRHLAGR